VNEITLISVISLGSLGTIAAVILYVVAQKFKVIEDPRIDIVAEKLPGANCGGCGYAGCRALAEEIVRKESLDGMICPPGGNDVMKDIAAVLGLKATEQEPTIAVIRCSGNHDNAPARSQYPATFNIACLPESLAAPMAVWDAVTVLPRVILTPYTWIRLPDSLW
jgi:Na+-translocating ferredoxin:NAD+ oxidoreductase subunit B